MQAISLNRWAGIVITGLSVICALGCEDLSPGVEPLADAETSTGQVVDSNPELANAAASKSEVDPEKMPNPFTGGKQASSPGESSSPPSSPPASTSNRSRVQLRTGVALAQTLPTGTCMTFSVDYEWVGVQPDSNSKYFLVIQSSKGQTVRQAVQVSSSGTFQAIVPAFRPDDGPFTGYLMAELKNGEQSRISETLSLK